MLILSKNKNVRMEHLQTTLDASRNSWVACWRGVMMGVIGKVTKEDIAVVLSIISYAIAIGYTVWKWIVEYKDRKRKLHRK